VAAGRGGRSPLGPAFWALWRAGTLSGLGDGIILTALPLLAARLTGNALLVSLVVVMQRLPWVIVAIPAGAFVDRLDPARAMVAADIIRGALLAGVCALLAVGELSMVTLCCAALGLGVFDTVFAAGGQAIIPRVVDVEALDLANSRLTVGQTTTGHFLGPALGGVLFALNQVLPFAADSASFFGSAEMLRGLRGRFRPDPRRAGPDGAGPRRAGAGRAGPDGVEPDVADPDGVVPDPGTTGPDGAGPGRDGPDGAGPGRDGPDGADTGPDAPDRAGRSRPRRLSLRADMAEGLTFFRHSPLLPLLALLTAGLALLQASILSPFVLFALRDLHLSRAGYGIFLAVAALGNVAGGLLAPRLRRRFSAATLFTTAGVLAGAAYLVVALTSSVVVAEGAFLVEAAAVAGGSVVSISLRQRHIPQALMGRVSNVFRSIIWGAIPLGALLGGVLADVRGLRSPFIVAGVAQIALVGLLALPLRRRIQAAGTPDAAGTPGR
jgi:MFS family permease